MSALPAILHVADRNVNNFIDTVFPLTPKERNLSAAAYWLQRKMVRIYHLEEDFGLIRQTITVVGNMIIAADRIFKEFPKLLGKWAVFATNAFGFLSVREVAADILKCALDFGSSLVRLDAFYSIYKLLQLVLKITDLALLIGVCTVSTSGLLNAEIYNDFYKAVFPYSLASFIAGLCVVVFDLYLDTKLYKEISCYRLSDELQAIQNQKSIDKILFQVFSCSLQGDLKAVRDPDPVAERMIDRLELLNPNAKRELSVLMQGWKPGTLWNAEQTERALNFYETVLRKRLIERDEEQSSSLEKLSRCFASRLLNPIKVREEGPEAELANRIIMQITTYDFVDLRQKLYREKKDPGFSEKEFFKKHAITVIESHMWHKSTTFGVRILNYAALAVCKAFPNTAIESMVKSAAGVLGWSNSYKYYLQCKGREKM